MSSALHQTAVRTGHGVLPAHVCYIAGKQRILRLTCRPKMQPGEEWVTYKVGIARMMRLKWKRMGSSSLAELCAEKVWKTMAWAVYEGEVPVLKSTTICYWLEGDGMVEKQ